jgi:putative AdoMet-dependent methyltransferase
MPTGQPMTWDFDKYDRLSEYDERWLASERLCYQATLSSLPRLTGAQPGDRVLDIGCGTGNSALPFLEAGCTVLGLDPSERMLELAKPKAAAFGGRFALRHLDDPFLALPLPDERFDIVISTYALHHLPDPDKVRAIGGLKASLRPGGRIAIGDTMFRDEAHKQQALREDESLEDEYQPLLTTFPGVFEAAGLRVELHPMGDLVWVAVAR